MKKLSVVISAFNEERKIKDCLDSVKDLADEIIVIDNSSTDRTFEIAKKITDKIYKQENDPQKIDVQKNFGIKKVTNDWFLVLDADERVTKALANEILEKNFEDHINGYFIPRKNIIFGKFIKHTGWYPDKQLRLIRRDKGEYEPGSVHKFIKVEGATGELNNDIEHLNYETISQFLTKTVGIYTISEANALLKSGYKFNFIDIITRPVAEFNKRYFLEKGYLDGFHGLVLSLLMGFYHFIIYLRIWEANGFSEKENSLNILKVGLRSSKKEINYWLLDEEIERSKNPIKKGILKVKRKAFL